MGPVEFDSGVRDGSVRVVEIQQPRVANGREAVPQPPDHFFSASAISLLACDMALVSADQGFFQLALERFQFLAFARCEHLAGAVQTVARAGTGDVAIQRPTRPRVGERETHPVMTQGNA